MLDSHTLYWLVSGEQELAEEALVAIGQNQAAGTLYVSPITGWELTIASRKRNDALNLGSSSPSRWFSEAIAVTEAKVIPIKQRIAFEAAAVVTATGHKDPGDCYLIATARVKKIPIITRDRVMRGLAGPNYLDVIVC